MRLPWTYLCAWCGKLIFLRIRLARHVVKAHLEQDPLFEGRRAKPGTVVKL